MITQELQHAGTGSPSLTLDLSGFADGQKVGLCHFAQTHSALGIVQDGETRRIEYRENGQLTIGPVIAGNQLWLKSAGD
jgi:hypothetical protein